MKRLLLKFKKVSSTIWPAIVWSALVFIIQMIPRKNLPSHNRDFAQDQIIPFPFFDKMMHLIFYSVLLVLWVIYLSTSGKIRTNQGSMLRMAIIIFGYGILIEYLQTYVGRDFSYPDLTANIFGVFLGVIAVIRLKKIPGFFSRD